jgi:hypothetical protein
MNAFTIWTKPIYDMHHKDTRIWSYEKRIPYQGIVTRCMMFRDYEKNGYGAEGECFAAFDRVNPNGHNFLAFQGGLYTIT